MSKAFVFGKFLPFHKGHEAMIRFALSKCDLLTVLVCCSDKETISGATRSEWIKETFVNESKIEVNVFNYLESELPNTSESSEAVSKVWAATFKSLLPDCSLLITSEVYGDYVARYMNITHIPYDISRKQLPISATAIRNNVFRNWPFLPESVKFNFVFKIVVLGTESTGKTTLTEKLAKHYDCSLVVEAGRELIPNSNQFTFDDLHLVALEHSKKIKNAKVTTTPMIVIDTDIHITKSYSKFTFGKELNVSQEIYKINAAHLYLYLNNDVDYCQDGTRLSENDRDLLDDSHRQILADHHINIIEIKGNWEERFDHAIAIIDAQIKEFSPRFKVDSK